MKPLPIDNELRDVIRRAKLQFAHWGDFTGTMPPVPFVRNIDLLVTPSESRNLADALAALLDLGAERISMSHQRRLAAIVVIHALEEIDVLREQLSENERCGYLVAVANPDSAAELPCPLPHGHEGHHRPWTPAQYFRIRGQPGYLQNANSGWSLTLTKDPTKARLFTSRAAAWALIEGKDFQELMAPTERFTVEPHD